MRFIKSDINDTKKYTNFLNNCDLAINIAAESHVDNSIKNPKNVQVNSVSQADELKKFADLKDKGIITEEEFNKKNPKGLSRTYYCSGFNTFEMSVVFYYSKNNQNLIEMWETSHKLKNLSDSRFSKKIKKVTETEKWLIEIKVYWAKMQFLLLR